MRLGMLATRMLNTDVLIFDNDRLSCVCKILRLDAGFCLSELDNRSKFLNRISVQAVPGTHLIPPKVRQVRFAPSLGLGGAMSRLTVLQTHVDLVFWSNWA